MTKYSQSHRSCIIRSFSGIKLFYRYTFFVERIRKYDHISQHRARLGWLPVESFVKYRSLIALFRDYYVGRGVSLNPALQFGRTHSYGTRCPAHHITTSRLKKSFSQKHFRHKVLTWWNSLQVCFRILTCFVMASSLISSKRLLLDFCIVDFVFC